MKAITIFLTLYAATGLLAVLVSPEWLIAWLPIWLACDLNFRIKAGWS